MEQLTIRPIAESDDARIAAIIRRNLEAAGLNIPGTAYYDEALDRLSAYYAVDSMRRYFVLTDGMRTLGGAGFEKLAGIPDCAELQKLYLCEEAKGQGLGERLLRYVEARAAEAGFRRLYLETHSCLDRALRLYARMGYREIPRPAFVQHGTMDRFYLKDLL